MAKKLAPAAKPAKAKTAPKSPKAVGRPKKQLDENLVQALAAIGCTNEEIAGLVKCDEKTLRTNFSQLLKRGRDGLKSSLRRKQVQMAESGNITMLIWLGKQYLGQSEKLVTENTTKTVKQFNPADLDAMRQAGLVMHQERERARAQRDAETVDGSGDADLDGR